MSHIDTTVDIVQQYRLERLKALLEECCFNRASILVAKSKQTGTPIASSQMSLYLSGQRKITERTVLALEEATGQRGWFDMPEQKSSPDVARDNDERQLLLAFRELDNKTRLLTLAETEYKARLAVINAAEPAAERTDSTQPAKKEQLCT